MTGELTLELDKTVIERAEQYAERRGVSLARLVEGFFTGITREEATNWDDEDEELAAMAADPEIIRENRAIAQELAFAEADGLGHKP